jgi:hypothetical protein
MYKTFLFFLFVCSFSFAQEDAPKIFGYGFEFESNQTAYLFGDKVKLRQGPSTNDSTLMVLPIGTAVFVISKTDEEITIYGIPSIWYKVSVDGQMGYIPSAFISFEKVTFGKSHFYFGLKAVEEYNRILMIREPINDTVYKEIAFNLSNSSFGIEAFDDRGVKGIQNVLHINYYAEACGVDDGGVYFFYNGKELIKAFEYVSWGDADIAWHHEELIFPEDEMGMEGFVIFSQEHEELIDEDLRWYKSEGNSFNITWTGTDFKPNPREFLKRKED